MTDYEKCVRSTAYIEPKDVLQTECSSASAMCSHVLVHVLRCDSNVCKQ